MKTPASFFPIALALGVITLTPGLVRAQDFREEGPIEIDKCQTISQPGSYKLVRNITLPTAATVCLTITTGEVTIDLAGFTISAPGSGTTLTSGIFAAAPLGTTLEGIAVRNGSISGFNNGVELSLDNSTGNENTADGSIVERLRIVGIFSFFGAGIDAKGIVKDNTVVGSGVGITGTGTVTGNYATGNIDAGIIGGGTVIGNTARNNGGSGLFIICPSNVTNNTAINNTGPLGNLFLTGTGCNDTNNVAP